MFHGTRVCPNRVLVIVLVDSDLTLVVSLITIPTPSSVVTGRGRSSCEGIIITVYELEVR